MAKKTPKIRFKEGLERLEKAVDDLERGELELEEALDVFEEGVRYYKELQAVLAACERRIEIACGEADGALVWEQFRGAQELEEKPGATKETD